MYRCKVVANRICQRAAWKGCQRRLNIFVLLACALVNLTVVQVALGAQGSYPRAATVLGILRYTFWDDHSGAYLNICLLGEGASFQSLLELDDTLDVQGKRLRVFIVEDNQVESCQAIITGGHSISRLPLSLCSSCLVICDQCKQHHR